MYEPDIISKIYIYIQRERESCQPLRFLWNHYDFLLYITPLRPYSENYDKSAFSRNCSVTVLATHGLHACISGSIPRLSLVQHSLCGAHHTAVDLELFVVEIVSQSKTLSPIPHQPSLKSTVPYCRPDFGLIFS